MKTLHLSKDLSVPADIATEAVAFIGARGSGKTHAAGKLFEELHDAGVQVVWLDPVGVAYGLRLARDGKAAGLPVPVFGGLHGDVPLEPGGGALVADVIVDKNISAVLDVSQFDTDADKARFVAGFSERLFARKKRAPSVIAMIIDEGQEFLPQNPQPGEQQMLHRLVRQIKIGRNFGMGVCILSPRPQEINKKALNGCQTVFAFRLTGAHERKAMREWIAAHDIDQGVIEKLPSLDTGTCHVWSPAFLKVNKEIRIAQKRTFDASATPKVGEHRAARELASIDIAQLKEAMAATVQKARAEDPKELQQRVRDLERRLAAKLPKEAGVKIHSVEVPVIKPAELKRAEALVTRLDIITARVLDLRGETLTELRGVVTALSRGVQMPLEYVKAKGKPAQLVTYIPPVDARTKRFAVAFTSPEARRLALEAPGDDSLSQPQQRILAALVFLQSIGVETADKFQVALFVGVSPNSGSYANNLGALRTAGLVAYPTPGSVGITPNGLAAAPSVTIPTNDAELHRAVLDKLSRPQQEILEDVLAAYPNPVTKVWIAEQVGVSATSGSFANNLGHLRRLGAIAYPKPGFVQASDIMFIDGRK